MRECQEGDLGLQNQRGKRKLRCFSNNQRTSEAATLCGRCVINLTCDVGALF